MEESLKNIDNFNLCTAHILGKLYDEFPVPRELIPAEIVTELKGAIVDDTERKINANTFVAHTVRWLVYTGYLIEKEGSTRTTNRYVLSPKAFEAMNAPLPSSLLSENVQGDSKTVGQTLTEVAVDTAKEAGAEARKKLIQQLVSQVFGLAIKAAAS